MEQIQCDQVDYRASEYEAARKIAEHVQEEGGTAYYVGGYVRDMVMGRPTHDIDIEVHGILSKTLNDILYTINDSVVLCGESFGIYKIGGLDVGLPRSEKSIGRGHKDFDVSCDPFIGLEGACRRRDFTINAMMQDILSGQLYDIFDGQSDINNRIVRCVDHNTFFDDPLRMLRAVRFASTFEYLIEGKTYDLIQDNNDLILDLPKERIFGELSKILLDSRLPSYGFRLLDELGLLERILPEIWELQFVEQSPIYHPEGDALTHTLRCLDYHSVQNRSLVTQLAILFHDCGKIDGSINHESRSSEIIRKCFPDRLTTNNNIIEGAACLALNHMMLYGGKISHNRVRRLVSKLSSNVTFDDLLNVVSADKLSRPYNDIILSDEKSRLDNVLDTYNDIKDSVEPIVMGRHIMQYYPDIEPGPLYNKILSKIYNRQLNGEFNDLNSGLDILKGVINGKKY